MNKMLKNEYLKDLQMFFGFERIYMRYEKII